MFAWCVDPAADGLTATDDGTAIASGKLQAKAIAQAGTGREGRLNQNRVDSGLGQSDCSGRAIHCAAGEDRPRRVIDFSNDAALAREGGGGNKNHIARLREELVFVHFSCCVDLAADGLTAIDK